LFFAVSNLLPGIFPPVPFDSQISPAEQFLGLHYPSSEYFKPFQIITHMFMHGGVAHIFFNMFNLYMFGTILERVWGPKRFLEFYFITGFGAMLLHTGVQAWEVHNISGSFAPPLHIVNSNQQLYDIINAPTVGASGAIFGLLTAFALLFANTELYLYGAIPVKAKYLVGGLIAYELWRGFANSPGDNVAHFAHLGGALIGFIMIRIWKRDRTTLY
jgi:rhomboid-like protein